MIDYLREAVEFTRQHSAEISALASCVGGIWVSRYLKLVAQDVPEKRRKAVNCVGSAVAAFAITVILYTGPEPLRVAAALAIFNPLIFAIAMLFVEYKATEKGGFWVKLLAWAKPHRVEGSRSVALKGGRKVKSK